MSFAAFVKKELVQIESSTCCQISELSALIKMNGTISLSSNGLTLSFNTENAAIARRVLELLKNNFSNIETSVLSRKKANLKKNNTYVIGIQRYARVVAMELGILTDEGFVHNVSESLIQEECCKRAYLRGAFLAGGSVNNPETSSYHFEIFTEHDEHVRSLQKLLNEFNLNARVLARKKGYITYIKEAEKISDFLRVVGAMGAVLNFEDVRIMRDIRNSDNRLNNCEIANETKTLTAADRQVEDIRLIESVHGMDFLSDKLRYVANLRLEFAEENLTYLSEVATQRGHKLTKSGINHRIRKIAEVANELRGG